MIMQTTTKQGSKMSDGYAYEFEGKRRWRASSSELWETVCYTPTGDEKAVGTRDIDGTTCVVYRCLDGKFRAQTKAHVDTYNRVAELFPWTACTALAKR